MKEEIKKDWLVLARKPRYCFYLPVLFFRFIVGRLYSGKDVILLTETELTEKHPLMLRPIPGHVRMEALHSFEEFEPFAKRRMKEEEVGITYLNLVESRFSQGYYALILYNNSSPVGYIFISEKWANFQQVNVEMKLPPRHFATYDGYTFERWRGKGQWSFLLAGMFRFMRKKGFKKLWQWVMEHNTVTLKVHCHLKIDRVVKVMSECYRFGFNLKDEKEVNFSLCDLLKDEYLSGKAS